MTSESAIGHRAMVVGLVSRRLCVMGEIPLKSETHCLPFLPIAQQEKCSKSPGVRTGAGGGL